MSIAFEGKVFESRLREYRSRRAREFNTPSYGGRVISDIGTRPAGVLHKPLAAPSVTPAPKPKPKSKSPTPRRHNLIANVTLMAAISLLGFGAWVSWMGFTTNQEAKVQVKELSAANANSDPNGTVADGEIPNESPLPANAISNHTVPPGQPRILSIPSLNVKARIKSVGVNSSNQLLTPSSIYDVGWYLGSSQPGGQGAVLLDGHVRGLSKPGVFTNLHKLGPGGDINVEKGDGTVVSYKIVTTKTYPLAETDMSSAVKSIDPSKQGLNIITCAGEYDKKTRTYSHRLIAYAVIAS